MTRHALSALLIQAWHDIRCCHPINNNNNIIVVLIIDVFMLIYLLRVDLFGDCVGGGGSMRIRMYKYK